MSNIIKNSLVRFFSSSDKQVVGAGFLTKDQHSNILIVVSCAHVINAALDKEENNANKPTKTELVSLDLPYLAPNEIFNARVISWHPKQADNIKDIAILQLETSPPANIQPATLIPSLNSDDHQFTAIGFPSGFKGEARATSGIIKGSLPNKRLQVQGDDGILGYFLESGFSGTPILDKNLGGIIGIAVTVDEPETQRSASIIPTEILQIAYPQLVSPVGELGAFFGPDAPSKRPEYNKRRKEKYNNLKNYVLKDNNKRLVILRGIGGIGKSHLALDFAQDIETREYFKDGVFWLTIGQDANEATLIECMQFISSNCIQQKVEQFRNINDAFAQLTKILEDKQCLIVLDDIWESMHVRPFFNSIVKTTKQCRLLVTTRRKQIAEEFEGREIELQLLSPKEAKGILQNYAGKDDPTFPKIVEKLGRLTLAVVLVGKQLREWGITGKQWLEEFDKLSSKVSSIEDETNLMDRDKSLKISIDLSINYIFKNHERNKALYYSLGVFPNNVFVSIDTIIQFWKIINDRLNSFKCRSIISKLDDQELLEQNTEKQSIILNDLLHAYNCENLDIDGSYLKNQNRLLSYYNPDNSEWYTIKNDGYLYKYLAYHLKKARREDELRALLLNFRWLEAKLNETEINALIADFDITMNKDEKNNRHSELNLVKSALQLSEHILVKQKNILWENLYGRLHFLPRRFPNIQRLLESPVDRVWLRPLELYTHTADGPLLQTLREHDSTILSIAMNDKFIISASDDGTLRVWNRSDLNLTQVLSGHQYGITSIALSDDGKHAISGSYDCTWKKWDLERDGKMNESQIFSSSQGSIFSVALSSDKTKVITGGQDGTLKVYDFVTGKVLNTLYGHEGGIVTVAISMDSNTIVSGSYDETIKIWNLATGEVINTLAEHQDAVLSVFLYEGEDKKIIVSGSADCSIKVWDFEQVQNGETNQPIYTLNQGIYGWVSSIYVSHDGNFVIFGSYDNTLRLWDFKTEQPTRLFHGHGRQITAVALSTDSSIAISGSQDNNLKLWDLNTEQKQPENIYSPRKILSVKTFENNNTIFCGSNDGLLQIYNTESRELITELERQDLIARSVDINEDGSLGVAGLSDGSVRVWNLETGRLKHRLTGHQGRVMTVALGSNSEIVVSGSDDGTIRVWDLKTDSEKFLPLQTNAHVHSVFLSPDSKTLYAGLRDSTIKAWNIELKPELRYERGEHKGYVHTITLSPDGKTLFSGSADKTIRAWNSETGAPLFEFPEHHHDWIWSLKVSQDGKLLMSASEDCTVRIWNIEDKENIATFHLENTVFDCAFATNNTIVVCCSSSSKPLFFKLENYS